MNRPFVLPKLSKTALAAIKKGGGIDLNALPNLTVAGLVKKTAVDHGEGWCEKHKVNHKPTTDCPYKNKDKGGGGATGDEKGGYDDVLEALKDVPEATLKKLDSLLEGDGVGIEVFDNAPDAEQKTILDMVDSGILFLDKEKKTLHLSDELKEKLKGKKPGDVLEALKDVPEATLKKLDSLLEGDGVGIEVFDNAPDAEQKTILDMVDSGILFLDKEKKTLHLSDELKEKLKGKKPGGEVAKETTLADPAGSPAQQKPSQNKALFDGALSAIYPGGVDDFVDPEGTKKILGDALDSINGFNGTKHKLVQSLTSAGNMPPHIVDALVKHLEAKGYITQNGDLVSVNLGAKPPAAAPSPTPAAPEPPPAPFAPKKPLSDAYKGAGTWANSEGGKAIKFLYDNPGKAFSIQDVIDTAKLVMPPSHAHIPVDKVVQKAFTNAVKDGSMVKNPDGTYQVAGTGGVPANVPAPTPAPAPTAPPATSQASPKSPDGYGSVVDAVVSKLPAPYNTIGPKIKQGIESVFNGLVAGIQYSYSNLASALAATLTTTTGQPGISSHLGGIFQALDDAGILTIDPNTNKASITTQATPTGICPNKHNTYKSPAPSNCPTCGTPMQAGQSTPAPAPVPAPTTPAQPPTPSADTQAKIDSVINLPNLNLNQKSKDGLTAIANKYPHLLDGQPLTDEQESDLYNTVAFPNSYLNEIDGKRYLKPCLLPPGVFGPYSTFANAKSSFASLVQNTDWYKAKAKTPKAKQKIDTAIDGFVSRMLAKATVNGYWNKKDVAAAAKAVGLPSHFDLMSKLGDADVFTQISSGDFLIKDHKISVPRHDIPQTSSADVSDDVKENVKKLMEEKVKGIDNLSFLTPEIKAEIKNDLLPKIAEGPVPFADILAIVSKAPGLYDYQKTGVTHQVISALDMLTANIGGKSVAILNPMNLTPANPGPYHASSMDAASSALEAVEENPAYQAATAKAKEGIKKGLLKLFADTSYATAGISKFTLSNIAKETGAPVTAFAAILGDAGILQTNASNYSLKPQFWFASQTSSPAPVVAPTPTPTPAPTPPVAPSPAPTTVGNPIAGIPAVKGSGALLNSLFAGQSLVSPQAMISALTSKIQQDSPTILTDDEAKAVAQDAIAKLVSSGHFKKNPAGDFTLAKPVPSAPKPLTVENPNLGDTLKDLGWNPAGKGAMMLTFLNSNGDAGQSIDGLMAKWPGEKPSAGLMSQMIDTAMEAGVVKRVPGSFPASYLFTKQTPPPADKPGTKPTGKCQKGHNTYKDPTPDKCPTCGTPMNAAPKDAPVSQDLPKTIAAIPNGDDLQKLGSAKGFGGIKDKYTAQDSKGNKYLCKPDHEGVRPIASQVASEIGIKILGEGTTLPVKSTTQGGVPISVQPLVDVAGDGTILDLEKLTPDQQKTLVRERVYDWLMGSHDTKAQNFIVSKSGQVIGIDKEQAFKFVGNDQLNNSYNPNPGDPPIYNKLFNLAQAGKINLPLQEALPVIERIEAITDEEYIGMISPYLNQAAKHYGWSKAKMEERKNALLARKKSIRSDFEKYFGKIKPGFTFQNSEKAAA